MPDFSSFSLCKICLRTVILKGFSELFLNKIKCIKYSENSLTITEKLCILIYILRGVKEGGIIL